MDRPSGRPAQGLTVNHLPDLSFIHISDIHHDQSPRIRMNKIPVSIISYMYGAKSFGNKNVDMDEDDVAAEASIDATCVARNCCNLMAGGD
jgi:hypothetical protein